MPLAVFCSIVRNYPILRALQSKHASLQIRLHALVLGQQPLGSAWTSLKMLLLVGECTKDPVYKLLPSHPGAYLQVLLSPYHSQGGVVNGDNMLHKWRCLSLKIGPDPSQSLKH